MERPVNAALGLRLPPWSLDLVPVAVALIVGTGALANREGTPAVLIAVLVATSLALLARRRAPVAVLAGVLGLMLAFDAAAVTFVPLLGVLLTLAEYGDRAAVIGATAAALVAVVAVEPLHGGASSTAELGVPLLAVALPVVAGLYLRARADYIGALRDRAERLQRERQLLAEQAAADERVRIARELHDVVSHSVSLMIVQAQALAATGADQDQRAALGGLAGLGREALEEMHRMLGVLRLQEDDGQGRSPPPGVGALGALIARVRRDDLDVELRIEGEPRPLEPAVELSVYRIVQEALTNVVRHADARRVAVVLRYAPEALVVTVTDDGAGPHERTENAPDAGHGLAGMRERVALFGGELRATSRPDGCGFRVRALVPTA